MSKTPNENKFHKGNKEDGKHYWLTPSSLYTELDNEFSFADNAERKNRSRDIS